MISKQGTIFETKCKKDYSSFFCKDEYYYCIVVEIDSCCVLYKLDGKTEISIPSHIFMGGVVYDHISFLNNDFTKYFYTESQMRLLKLKKLNSYEKI